MKAEELMIGNVLFQPKELNGDGYCVVTALSADRIETTSRTLTGVHYRVNPVPITKEILKYNLGFETHDLGDYWNFEKGNMLITQVKIMDDMPFTFGLKTHLKTQTIEFRYVHHIQNFYYALNGEKLDWIGEIKS